MPPPAVRPPRHPKPMRRPSRARLGRALLGAGTALLIPMAAAADVELRWPLAEQAASVAIDRGRDEQSLVPLVRLPGDVTAYRDPSPPDGPKLCYRVRPMTSDDRAIEEFMRCLTPDAAPEAPGNDTPGDAPPGDDPTRWRGLEGWYQSVPLPPQPPETGS